MPFHTHLHEQSSCIVKGSLKLIIENDEVILNEGMAGIVPPNVKHKAIALEDTVDVNSFTPVREDYLS